MTFNPKGRFLLKILMASFICLLFWQWSMPAAEAFSPLASRVNEAFRGAFGRNPTAQENHYWLERVVRGDKNTFQSLRDAMLYHRGLGRTIGDIPSTPANVAGTQDTVQQMIIQTLPLFFGIYGSDPSEPEKAWWRKRISCGEITSMRQLEGAMRHHHAAGVRIGRPTICGQTAPSSGNLVRASVAGIENHPMGNHVRIGIFNTDGRAIHVTSNGQYQIREGGFNIRATLDAGQVTQVSWSDGNYHIRAPGVSFSSTREIRLVPLNMAVMQINSYSDPSPTIAGKNYNRFRGIVEIRKCNGCNELWAINELRLEYYLRGLAETSGTGPEEYITALGIAARTYVLYHQIVTGGRSPAKGYDIGRTAADQIYRGYEYEIITPRMSNIFNNSRGIVVTDQSGRLVPTVYFSDSDGRTRSALEVWNTTRFPHLQHSVSDPHHVSSTCRGHCVGMSAQGAFGFARHDNWSWQRILSYYFKDVRFIKAY